MNSRLKSTLDAAWNDPRHFFLWLALLCLCGAATGFLGLIAAGVTTFLAAVFVGSAVAFMLSLLAWFLSWIPPVRRLLTWLLRRRFLVLGCLVTLVALFYAVEDWRGRSGWQTYKRGAEARGEHFGWASLAPAPVPDGQNLFETPLWEGGRFVQTNGRTTLRDTNWNNEVLFGIYSPNPNGAPASGNWRVARPTDLAAWQAYYRGTNNLFAAQNGPATNYFPLTQGPQTPAQTVLTALGRFDANRRLLIEAAARPQARFWVNYDSGPGMLLPHLTHVKSTATYLALHAVASLKEGDRETALQDVKLIFRMMDSLRGEPILISHLVRIAMLQIGLQPVWEGLDSHQWTEADLSAIESELGKLDFLADYELALRGERACFLWAVDYVSKRGFPALEDLGGTQDEQGASGGNPNPSDWAQLAGAALFKLLPAGWFEQNDLFACAMYDKYMLPLLDPARRLVSPLVSQEPNPVGKACARTPYRFLAAYMLPAAERAAQRCAYAQDMADLARVACALERYRLAQGQFPEALDALAPKFIAEVPHDLMNGEPLKYQRTDDGRFVLYSVGWNRTDDGGAVGRTKAGNPDVNKGDWVWRYPSAKPTKPGQAS